MAAAPQVVEEKGTEEILKYIEALKGEVVVGTQLTENGSRVLKFMQSSDAPFFKAREIGEQLGVASRTVSGSLRKLVNDGYVDKMGSQPTLYSLSEKGKTYIFEGETVNEEDND